MQVHDSEFVHSTISDYARPETAKFKGQFFADPTRKLYHALGMDIESLERTPKGQPRPSYISLGPISDIIRSLWVSTCFMLTVVTSNINITIIKRGPIKNPSFIGKNGNISQLGGEFIFGPGRSIIIIHPDYRLILLIDYRTTMYICISYEAHRRS